jgi:glycosyltransferase involved in cell wall biosynthesis
MVATDIPGCREIVVPGVTGLLVPRREVAPLAAALALLLGDRSLCERMGAAARAKAEAEFGFEKIVAETLAVYYRVLAAS